MSEASRDAAVVGCADGAVYNLHGSMAEDMGYDVSAPEVDFLLVPGGGATTSQHNMDQLAFLQQAHGFNTVILAAHTGCAAVPDPAEQLNNMQVNAEWARNQLGVNVVVVLQDGTTDSWREV